MDPTVTSSETGSAISSTAEIIEEEYLTSKTVEDEDTILSDTNDTMDLGKIIVNEVKRDTLTQDQIYRYFKHQSIPSENEDLFKKQVKKTGKTFALRFKHKITLGVFIVKSLKEDCVRPVYYLAKQMKSIGGFSSKEHIRILTNQRKY